MNTFEIVIGFASVAIVVIGQTAAIAYFCGQMSQQIKSLSETIMELKKYNESREEVYWRKDAAMTQVEKRNREIDELRKYVDSVNKSQHEWKEKFTACQLEHAKRNA